MSLVVTQKGRQTCLGKTDSEWEREGGKPQKQPQIKIEHEITGKTDRQSFRRNEWMTAGIKRNHKKKNRYREEKTTASIKMLAKKWHIPWTAVRIFDFFFVIFFIIILIKINWKRLYDKITTNSKPWQKQQINVVWIIFASVSKQKKKQQQQLTWLARCLADWQLFV